MTAFMHVDPCANMNHRRRDAPVSHCPQCGGVVNALILTAPCSDDKHSVARRRRSVFCVDCGTQLVTSR